MPVAFSTSNPLEGNTRYKLQRPLKAGAFGFVLLFEDGERGGESVVRELAIPECRPSCMGTILHFHSGFFTVERSGLTLDTGNQVP